MPQRAGYGRFFLTFAPGSVALVSWLSFTLFFVLFFKDQMNVCVSIGNMRVFSSVTAS